MGCGQSSLGRDSHSNLPREAESFFPPPEIDSNPQKTSAVCVTERQSAAQDPHAHEAPETSGAVAHPFPNTQTASPKKKSTYVPPAPITETVVLPKPQASPRVSPKSQKHPFVPPPPAPVAAPTCIDERQGEQEVGSEDFAPTSPPRRDTSAPTAAAPAATATSSLAEDTTIAGSVDTAQIVDSASGSKEFSKEGPSSVGENNFTGTIVEQNLVLGEASIDPSVLSGMSNEPADASAVPAPPAAENHFTPDDTPEPSSLSGMRFDELYRLKGVLGTGAFSTVREGFHRTNAQISYAVKCINRKKLSEEDEKALLDEVAILKEMKHIHIIRLYDFFEEPSTYYLVMERMRGGELFDRIVAKAYYNEKEARDTCKILLEAVKYCHDNHVAHRDLKPENLLLLSEEDDSAVKIADFGFAKKVFEPSSLTTQCGTPGYVAPEILEGTPYDERADMWSVGVILYILLGGYPPFIESTQRDLFRKIRKGEYEFHEEYWGTVSSDAKELISCLLTVDPGSRLDAGEALENLWILGDGAKLAKKDLGINLDKLRNFNAKRKFRAAVSTIIACQKLNYLSKAFFKSYEDVGDYQHDVEGGEEEILKFEPVEGGFSPDSAHK